MTTTTLKKKNFCVWLVLSSDAIRLLARQIPIRVLPINPHSGMFMTWSLNPTFDNNNHIRSHTNHGQRRRRLCVLRTSDWARRRDHQPQEESRRWGFWAVANPSALETRGDSFLSIHTHVLYGYELRNWYSVRVYWSQV